jgi:hypothetical protein
LPGSTLPVYVRSTVYGGEGTCRRSRRALSRCFAAVQPAGPAADPSGTPGYLRARGSAAAPVADRLANC